MLGKATHARSRTSLHETACGIPLSNVLVGEKVNCLRCRKAKKHRMVQTAEEARAVWKLALVYLGRIGRLTPWTAAALAREKQPAIDRRREVGRRKVYERRSNMTVEDRRQEWTRHQRARRERLKREKTE